MFANPILVETLGHSIKLGDTERAVGEQRD